MGALFGIGFGRLDNREFSQRTNKVGVQLRDSARRVITPADALWDDFFAALGLDLPERDQPEAQARPKL